MICQVDHRRIAPIGSRRTARLNLEFLNGIYRREEEDIAGVVLDAPNPVEHVDRIFRRVAVDNRTISPSTGRVALRYGVACGSVVIDTGR